MELFDGNGSDGEDMSKIEINEEYARRFEHNKKREDLQRLEELKKKGLVEDDDSTDSEDDIAEGLMDSYKKDLEFFDVLIKVKNQDPVIKEKDAKLFNDDEEEEEEEEEDVTKPEGLQDKKKKKKPKGLKEKEKPMYLKDVVAKHLIEEGPEFEEKESEFSAMKSFSEEQEELRKAFLDAAEEGLVEDEGDLFKEKNKGKEVVVEDDNYGEVQKKVDEYFGDDDELDEGAIFLKDYFRNKMWAVKDEGGEKGFDEVLDGVSEDEELIEKQEEYEREYCFRYQDGAGDRILGHSRFTEGSVRKKTNSRKVQRKSKEERRAQAELERKEELKHLKNLKKKEILEKVKKIREIAGIGEDRVCPLNEDDLEDDFDPTEYDRKMKELFDEEYYDAVDADPEFGSDRDEDVGDLEKPDFDKKDELLGLPKDWDVLGPSEGFLAARERKLKGKIDTEGDHDQEEDIASEEGKRKRKRKMSLSEKVANDKEWEEIYKLDYEGTIGDLKTRFKYTNVEPKRFRLSTEEILMMDEKELNQYVSLKKIAPYRDREWKVPENKIYNQKMRNKLLLQGGKLDDQKAGKKNSSGDDRRRSNSVTGAITDGKAQLEESNGDMGNISRGSKRRRRQAELKLSHSRLMAYGKIPPKPKSKANL